MPNSDAILIEVINRVLSTLPEKERFYNELEKMQIKPKDIPNSLQVFHAALKSTFGIHHYAIESLIIKTLHENVTQGIYREKEASQVAIRLLDVFIQEHKKEIAIAKKHSNKSA